MKVVHIPFSIRNPYQKLLSDALETNDIHVKGAPIRHFRNISFLNLSLLSLLFSHWKPDIIHLHWQSSFIHVEGSRFKTNLKSFLFLSQLWIIKQLGIKLVWTVHNLKRHEETYRDLESRFTGKLAEQADHIIVHCRSAMDRILQQFGNKIKEKIVVIGHGNFTEYYPNTITRENARNKLSLPSSRLTFLFLGELRYYKGIIELLETFCAMDNQNLQLLIAGRPHDGKIASEIRMKTNGLNNIQMHMQYVPDNRMQDYIQAADVMVFPYRDIFTSGGIFLGLSFGKPIIAPNVGCIADVLRGSSNFLYDPEKKNGLLDAMTSAIQSKKRLAEAGRENIALAVDHSWKPIAEKTRLVYHSIIETDSPSCDVH